MLKIKTTKLQEMLSRAVQGAPNSKLDPLTGLLALSVSDGKLTLTTTDKKNYLYIIDEVDSEDFYVCVSVEKFPKLIARMTCEDVQLDLKDKYLEVKGNGTYQIEFQLDEDGQMVEFPKPMNGMNEDKVGEVRLVTVKNILTNIRPALATKGTREQYFHYFVGDIKDESTIIATDTSKISALKAKFFTDGKARLISSEMMNLLDTMIDESIEIYGDGDKLKFVSEHGIVFGSVVKDELLQQFNQNAIAGFIYREYPSVCKLPKAEILQALDRISLFVESLDNDVLVIKFVKDGLVITSRKDSGEEKIPYLSCEGEADFTGIILLDRFRTQVKAQTGDAVQIHFGEPKAVKLTDENSVFVIALGSIQ